MTAAMHVAFASHTGFESPFRVGSHHLAARLAARGHRVTYLTRPFTPTELAAVGDVAARARIRRAGRRWTTPVDGVQEWLPRAAVPARWAARRFDRTGRNGLLRAFTRRACRRIGRPDVLVVDEPRFAGVEARLGPRRVVYRATDLMADMHPWLAGMEAHWAGRADALVATSEPVAEHLRRLAPGTPCHIIENGVDTAHFSAPGPEPADLRPFPRPRALYVGATDARFDGALVDAAARALPHVSFVLIGPTSAPSPGGDPPNLHRLGPRRYEALPAYLQHADVGLLPLSDHKANRGRSPMKLYEYMAAGLPVVATRTEELARRRVPGVTLCEGLRGFADAVQEAVAAGLPKQAAKAALAGQDWDDKAGRLEAILADLAAGAAP